MVRQSSLYYLFIHTVIYTDVENRSPVRFTNHINRVLRFDRWMQKQAPLISSWRTINTGWANIAMIGACRNHYPLSSSCTMTEGRRAYNRIFPLLSASRSSIVNLTYLSWPGFNHITTSLALPITLLPYLSISIPSFLNGALFCF
jgi:hypothetical protein